MSTINNLKIGVLGGGQLGKMFCIAASNLHLNTYILDRSADFPAGTVCSKFIEGNFKDYDDVYRFGQQVDVLTIEIEHVNTDALLQLEKEGKQIHPSPSALNIIKDKGLQKQFYKEHQLPTSSFELYDSKEAILDAVNTGKLSLPFVQKSRTAGYDGKGVVVIKTMEDLDKVLATASVVEPLVAIQKELAVIAARSPKGEVKTFPVVEMEFNPTANLVEYLFCPANISESQDKALHQLAAQIIETYDICGLLAIEFFLTTENEVLINEVAPRPHNSGHHTIDSAHTSQYEQHLRAILNLPLGNTENLQAAVMVNLLGEDGFKGAAQYTGLEDCLKIDGAHLHLYGKAETKPFRKMGHATVVDTDLQSAKRKAIHIKETLKIIASESK